MPIDSMNVLFIDDDRDFLETAKDNLHLLLEEDGISAQITPLESVDDGIKELQSGSYHLAVVDLRFDSSKRSGNDIIRDVLDTKILPIIVLSGYPDELEDEFRRHGLIYNTARKKTDEVVAKIVEWNQKEVFSFFSETGFLKSALREAVQRTMWEHVSRYWEYIDSEDPDILHRIAGRIAATILHDVLASRPEYASSGGEVLIHHGEVYIFNTPRNYLAVGDILDIEEDHFIVLSPTCDLIVRPSGSPKADKILLAHCHELGTFISENQTILDQVETIRDSNKSKTKKDRAKDRLQRLMRQDWENRSGQYFFLPPFAEFTGVVVDFLDLCVEPHGGGELIEQRVVSLNRELAAELATRFARYMIRLGHPPYEPLSLIKAVCGTV